MASAENDDNFKNQVDQQQQQQTINTLINDIKQLKIRKTHVSDELQCSKIEQKKLEEDKKQNIIRSRQLQHLIEHYKNKLARLNNELNQLQKKQQMIKNKVDQQQPILEAYQNNLEQQLEELEKYNEKLEIYEDEKEHLEKQKINKLQQYIQQLKHEINGTLQCIQLIENEMKYIEHELENIYKNIQQNDYDLEKFEENISKIKSKILNIEHEHDPVYQELIEIYDLIDEISQIIEMKQYHKEDNNIMSKQNEQKSHLSYENIDVQLPSVVNNYLIDISIQPYKHFNSSSQQSSTNNIPILLKSISYNTFNILIACLGIDSSLTTLNSKYSIESFDNECICIARLLSITDTHIYFIVSNLIGRYVIPLIYQHRYIEQIYIYCSNDNQQNLPWITQFSKIRDCWTDFNTLSTAVYDDIQSNLLGLSLLSNMELLEKCHYQILIDSSNKSSISLDIFNIEKFLISNKQIHIVVLHCDNNILFNINSQHFHLSQFFDVNKCIEYLKTIDIKSVFFIISGENKNIIHDLKAIMMINQIYTIYLFMEIINEQELDETIQIYKNIGRLFDNLEFLLNCLIIDIKYYLEYSHYISTISVFTLQGNIKDKRKLCLSDKEEKFVAFQLFINTLREYLLLFVVNKNYMIVNYYLAENNSDNEQALEILKTETNKIFDSFINMSFLSIIINSFLQEQIPQNLLDIQQILMTIDEHFSNVLPTTSSSVVYRVQLLREQDLKTIQENVNQLITFHTYLLTTQDLLTARTIARQAAHRGLLVIIFQIDIPKRAYVLELNNNRLLFRFGIIFRIKSIDQLDDPNQTYYVKLELYTDQTSLVTFAVVLRQFGDYERAKKYYQRISVRSRQQGLNVAQLHHNWGRAHFDAGEYNEALAQHLVALQHVMPSEMIGMVVILTDIAATYQALGNINLAELYCHKAMMYLIKNIVSWN
ncbi:unnamed protein product, partial [Rotaria sp. Silwood2]